MHGTLSKTQNLLYSNQKISENQIKYLNQNLPDLDPYLQEKQQDTKSFIHLAFRTFGMLSANVPRLTSSKSFLQRFETKDNEPFHNDPA